MAKEMSDVVAITKFFQLEGEKALEIGKQVKQLSDEDRAELAPLCREALAAQQDQNKAAA